MASLITRPLKVQPLRLAMSKSLGTALRSAILRGSAFHFKFNPPQQPLLSLPSRIQVARLHQVSNSSRNKKLESIFVRRLFHASRPLRQHHDQGSPPPLQSNNLEHVVVGAVAVLTLIALGGLFYFIYLLDQEAAQQAAVLKALKSYPYKHMEERKAVIKMSNMSEDMQQDAVDCATQALEKYNIEEPQDIATFIKNKFDKKYNPSWQVIVGPGAFGFSVSNKTKHYIIFHLGQVCIVLFKSG